MKDPYTIYCDMDGVLADFSRGVREALGKGWDDPFWSTKERKQQRNKLIMQHKNWWENLPVERDFDQLWGFINNFHPHILTAYAEWDESGSRHGKWIWAQKHLHVPFSKFHCVVRESKRYYAKEHDGSYFGRPNVLIDDFPQNITEWQRAGGIGILHTSGADTIQRLKKLGFST